MIEKIQMYRKLLLVLGVSTVLSGCVSTYYEEELVDDVLIEEELVEEALEEEMVESVIYWR